MQVERPAQAGSGGRVRNTWVTYPQVRNTGEKSPTIPHTLLAREAKPVRALEDEPASD